MESNDAPGSSVHGPCIEDQRRCLSGGGLRLTYAALASSWAAVGLWMTQLVAWRPYAEREASNAVLILMGKYMYGIAVLLAGVSLALSIAGAWSSRRCADRRRRVLNHVALVSAVTAIAVTFVTLAR